MGLLLCARRYYDPANSRWLTLHPMEYDGGVNLNGYCGNDPVDRTDPRCLGCRSQYPFPRRLRRFTPGGFFSTGFTTINGHYP